jgi:MFS-type transporter involved in bile tolerance (Atg22 family)
VATVIPISDRRARLAVILAGLGVPSLGITVPAAIWLGVGAVRQQRLSSGAEPAMGFIALVVAGLDVMMLNPVLLTTADVIDPRQAWIGIGCGVALATAVGVCTASTLRIHPERWGALLVARTGLIGAMVGGTALFVRLITVIS